MSMKQNANTAAKVFRLRKQRNKARHELRLMKSARDNVQAQLARERKTWEAQRREGLEANQAQAGTIQALRADLERERYDVAMGKCQLRAATQAIDALLAELDQLDSLYDIRQRIEGLRSIVRLPQPSDHHHHIHVSMGEVATKGTVSPEALVEALQADQPRTEPRFGGILPTDLLAERRPQRTHDVRDIDPQPSVHDASSSERLNWFARKAQRTELLGLLEDAWGIIANAGPIEQDPPTATPGWSTAALRFREGYHDLLRRLHPSPMVEPARTEEELEDELLDARAAQAMAEYQERTGLTAEQVAAKTARGLLDAIDSPLADSTPEEVAALAALADTLAPLRQYEPLSDPAGIVTQDRATGQVVDDTSAACEARIAPTGETTAQPATGFAYTPGSEAASAALAHDGTTDAQAAQAAREAALEAGEHVCFKREPHLGHEWWDDHEPDATKWFCEGIPFPEPEVEPTGDFTVRDTDGSTATYAWDGTEPISTTPAPPPPIELEPERYEALLTYLREELDAEEPEADASDILEALGLWVPEEWAQPTELEMLAEIAPPTGAVDRLVADVLAHAKGGINNPGDWFLTAASAFYPELGTYGSSQRDHIWSMATELARQRITADHTATAIILEREQEALAVTTERVGRFTETLAGYDAMLAQLGAPPA